MRKKIKEIMNKEEGFTLVELLAVIVILGIIVAIAVPAIGNVISKAETGANEAEKELVIDAARLYYTTDDTGKAAAKTKSETKISVKDLIKLGYLDVDLAKDKGENITAGGATRAENGSITYTDVVDSKLPE